MKRIAWFLALTAALTLSALGQTLAPEQLARVEFEQRLGATVPLNEVFRDETGAPARLGNLFGIRPVVLAFVYYDCPNLCTLVLNGMLESLRNVRLEAGRDFDIVVVSIKPNDSPALASQKKHTYTMRYGRPGSAKGWHFLIGAAEPIRALSEAAGFHYIHEPASNQYAHASGIVVLTPEGKISRYFMGIEYPPKDVRLALVEASRNNIGSLADRLLLLCFHYNPSTGRYSLFITRIVQIAGAGTVFILAGLIFRLSRREHRRNPETVR